MEVHDFYRLVEKCRYPNVTFSVFGNLWHVAPGVHTLSIQLHGVKGLFDGVVGPITFQKSWPTQAIAMWTEKDAKMMIFDCLDELITHEMAEQFEIGDDRPFYPHGSWSERKEEYQRSQDKQRKTKIDSWARAYDEYKSVYPNLQLDYWKTVDWFTPNPPPLTFATLKAAVDQATGAKDE